MLLWFLYFGRPEETSKKSLLLLWTQAAMMLDWGNHTLDITTAGIVGTAHCCTVLDIALCWYWQCLLTVGGNLLPHILTLSDVTTVAWYCRENQDVLHPAECQQQYCKYHSDSGEQVSLLTDTATELTAVCVLKFIAYSSIWHCTWAFEKVQQTSVSRDTLQHLR